MSFLRLLLVVAAFYAPLFGVSHGDEIDCDEQNCLVCNAYTDEYRSCSSHPFFLVVKPTDLIFSAEDKMARELLKANQSIREPPQYGYVRGKSAWEYSKNISPYLSVWSCFVLSLQRLQTLKSQIVKNFIVWCAMPIWTKSTWSQASSSILMLPP